MTQPYETVVDVTLRHPLQRARLVEAELVAVPVVGLVGLVAVVWGVGQRRDDHDQFPALTVVTR